MNCTTFNSKCNDFNTRMFFDMQCSDRYSEPWAYEIVRDPHDRFGRLKKIKSGLKPAKFSPYFFRGNFYYSKDQYLVDKILDYILRGGHFGPNQNAVYLIGKRLSSLRLWGI